MVLRLTLHQFYYLFQLFQNVPDLSIAHDSRSLSSSLVSNLIEHDKMREMIDVKRAVVVLNRQVSQRYKIGCQAGDESYFSDFGQNQFAIGINNGCKPDCFTSIQ